MEREDRAAPAHERVPRLRPVRRESPTEQVREQLLKAIEAGDYAQGDLLPSERVLCETFGVSRVSVREAIAGLEAIGLVTVQHGKGAFVSGSPSEQVSGSFQRYLSTHREELLDLLNVRGALDELAAAEAAANARASSVAEIVKAQRAFKRQATLAQLDYSALADLDVRFHLSIAEASGSQLLYNLLADLHGAMQDSRRMTLARSERQPQLSVVQHGTIVDAIVSRDQKRARREAERHLAGIRSWVEGVAAAAARPGKTGRERRGVHQSGQG
jgi:GntR family transcriptional repressor for pyruvate dehydrogenase complex